MSCFADSTRLFSENSGLIAFNSNGSLFFNYYFFLKLGLPEGIHETCLLSYLDEVLAFWFMVFCHEIAHNVHRPHDTIHEGVMAWLAMRHMKRLYALQPVMNLSEVGHSLRTVDVIFLASALFRHAVRNHSPIRSYSAHSLGGQALGVQS